MKKSVSLAVSLTLAGALSTTAGAASYKVIKVENGGAISGKVIFKGKDPDPKIFAITKDPETCGTGNRMVDFVKVNNGALNDVVVYLSKVKQGKAFQKDQAGGDINQKGCAFAPFLQVMQNGAEVSVLNSDPVSHNIHTYEILGRAKKTVFNVSQPDQNSVIKKTVKLRRGTAMKIECDQHDFMQGFVFVAKNPYYAVVGDDGSFSIDNIPPGKYKINAWHGTLKNQKSKVTVAAGGKATVNFEFKGK